MILLVRMASALLALCPEFLMRALTAASGEVLFLLARGRRRIVLEQLSHAFPEKSAASLRRLGRATCRRTVESLALGLIQPHLAPDRLRRIVRPGESLRAALPAMLRDGRPAVWGVPHLGAWELGALLPLLSPDPLPATACIYRPLNSLSLDRWVRAARSRFGVRMLSRRDGFAEATRLLRQGGLLLMFFDQNAGDRGVLSLFLDRLCATSNLPGLLAEKFRARVGFYFVRRTGFWRYTLELVLDDSARPQAAVVTRWLDAQLEHVLRGGDDLAATWLWLHRRWKTQNEPARRLRLEPRKSFLPADAGATLPRRTRFFVRLPNWLGDLVMAVPLLRALRRSRPDAEITIVVAARLAPLVARTGLAEHVVPLGPRSWRRFPEFRRLRERYPDTWLLFTNSVRGDVEAWLTGCPQRFGMVRPGKPRPLLSHGWHLPPDLDETREHQVRVWERWCRHFGLAGEPDLSPLPLRDLPETLPVASAGESWIGFIPGTENLPEKRWPVVHWRALLGELLAAFPLLRCALFGTAADCELTRAVAAQFPGQRVCDLAGATDLPAFAGALRQCRLVVTNDSGGMHLASMLGVPLVALFGPTNPVRTGPIFAAPRRVLQPPGCPPTGGGELGALAPATVLAAVRDLLGPAANVPTSP